MSQLLLERDDELALAEHSRDAALGGHGSLLVIEGVPGIGKTRLLDAIVERTGSADMTVLRARGGELERGFAYGVVRQLFEATLHQATANRRRSLLSGLAARASDALGNAREVPTAKWRDRLESFAVVHGLYSLTANMGAVSPLAIVVDDAQWADVASLRFLAYLGRRLEKLPVTLVMACRPAGPGAQSDVIAEVTATAGARLVQPRPLTETAVARLLRCGLNARADRGFVTACHSATAGNPFYLVELIGTLREDGIRPTAESAHAIRDVQPQTLSRTILLRLSRLPAEAGALAEAVAVLGGQAELREAAQLARLDLESAARAAAVLARGDLFTSERQLAFVHAIVRGAVYGDIAPAERAVRHADAAHLLAATDASIDQVAEHLLLVEPTGDPWVVATLREAARDALSRGAPAIAAQRLRRALAEPPATEATAPLLRELGLAYAGAGAPAAAAQCCERALDCEADPRARAETLLGLRSAFVDSGRAPDSVALLDEAIAAVADIDPELALMLETGLIASAQLDVETGPVAAERLGPLRARMGEGEAPGPGALGVVALGLALSGEQPVHAIAEIAERGAELLLAGTSEADSDRHARLVLALMLSERFAAAAAVLDHLEADARRRGWLPQLRQSIGLRALSAYRQGMLVEAETHARSGIATSSEQAEQFAATLCQAVLLSTLVERGALAEARAELEEFGVNPGDGSLYATWLLHARGKLSCAEGRTADGLADLLESGSRCGRLQAPCPTVSPWRSDAALAHLALGDEKTARRLAREELAYARVFAAPRSLGMALRTAGMVQGERGLTLLREAVTVLESSGARLEHARALVDLGATLRRGGRRAQARELLGEGSEGAHACGASALEQRAGQELRASGARRRAQMVTGRDTLTASEGRIAALAAQGLASREIARSLFITSRTVENHLARVYLKLGIHSRKELLAQALER